MRCAIPVLLTLARAVIGLYPSYAAYGTGATYYVAVSGSNKNPGNLARPWLTIQHAANVVVGGDTVVVEPGSYATAGPILVNLGASGTADKPISFQSQVPYAAVLTGNNNVSKSAFKFGPRVAFIKIKGFDIEQFGGNAVSINGGTSSQANVNHDVVVSGNHIHHIGNYLTCSRYGHDGIFARFGSYNIVVTRNEVDHVGRTNKLADFRACSPRMGSGPDHGLYIGGHNITITNNLFHDNNAGWDIQAYGKPGVLSTGWFISNNTFGHHLTPFGSACCGNIVAWRNGGDTPSGTLSNNIFWNSPTAPFVCYPTATTGSPVWKMQNNLVNNRKAIWQGCMGATINESGEKINIDPRLVSMEAPRLNFRPQRGSPVLGAGVHNAVTVDYAGSVRPNPPSIGAFEVPPMPSASATPQ
jgi:hypothetical protein